MRTLWILCTGLLLSIQSCSGSNDSVPPPPAPPTMAPTGLQASAGDSQVALTWNAVSGATSYRLKRWALIDGNGNVRFTQIALTQGTSYLDARLINGTTYRYHVSAVNAGGEGPLSGEVFAELTTPLATTLAWNDEFEGANGSLPDATKWTYDLGGGGWGNNELETYTNRAENAQIQDGLLMVTAARETYVDADLITRNYTSARLKTQGIFAQQYGKIEARIQVPAGQGIWPAFWMIGNNIGDQGWPACGEIDVMENIGREPATNHGSLHGPGYSGGNSLSNTWRLASGQLSDDFHVYTLIWKENLAQFYVDGELYQIRCAADVPSGSIWAFNHSFFLILNIAVGSNQSWPGAPDASTVFPQKMYVDWVRVYDLD